MRGQGAVLDTSECPELHIGKDNPQLIGGKDCCFNVFLSRRAATASQVHEAHRQSDDESLQNASSLIEMMEEASRVREGLASDPKKFLEKICQLSGSKLDEEVMERLIASSVGKEDEFKKKVLLMKEEEESTSERTCTDENFNILVRFCHTGVFV